MTDVETSRLVRAPAEIRARYDDVVAKSDGAELWAHAVADVRAGIADDRPLYWARLKLGERLRNSGQARAALLAARGFRPLPKEPTALLTAFDPFKLESDIGQSNPSGVAGLLLDNTIVAGVRVRAAILPVSFSAFDDGIVETLLTPYLAASNHVSRLCLTLSMGRDGFDLERFPGRRRSSRKPDNAGRCGGGTLTSPRVPPGLQGVPEFLEFSLPATAMAGRGGRWPVRDNRKVLTLRRGAVEAESLASLAGTTAVAGSGGGYLSNEVAYRALSLRRRLGATIPVGHLHMPKITGHDAAAEQAMVNQVRDMLEAALNEAT